VPRAWTTVKQKRVGPEDILMGVAIGEDSASQDPALLLQMGSLEFKPCPIAPLPRLATFWASRSERPPNK
jgi:hypothetical protein